MRPGGSPASLAATRRADRTILALGEVHDLDVLREILEALPTGSARGVLLDDLADRRARALERVARLLRSRRLQRFGRPD
jgi:CHAD domain-containing protein